MDFDVDPILPCRKEGCSLSVYDSMSRYYLKEMCMDGRIWTRPALERGVINSLE